MNCNELATVSGYDLPILIVLMNNQALGMVRQWQKLFQEERYAETTIAQNVDYCKLAGAYGIDSVRADDLKTLAAAVQQYKETGKALFVECKIDQNEDVYPIVPPGQSIDKYILR
jgi:acetolactate synthase-1/2/3 large subunit